MTQPTAIVCCRQDLRLDDNPALNAAVQTCKPVVPVFIWDPDSEGDWSPGGASRCWLHFALKKLEKALHDVGSRLVIREGPTLECLLKLIDDISADCVFWNRRYEPAVIARDCKIKTALTKRGLRVESFNALLLFEPWTVKTKTSTPYKVFTPFYRACLSQPEPDDPISAPSQMKAPAKWPTSAKLEALNLLPRIHWDTSIREAWTLDESAEAPHIDKFVHQALADYPTARDRPDVDGTSRVSPYLHSGELSPHRLWHAVRAATRRPKTGPPRKAAENYLRELIWREFAYHLLFHFPKTVSEPLNPGFAKFAWRKDPRGLKAWHKGQTGYPIVDAGMRQLWTTGWMHNRVRMIVGSFLVKDLLLPWQDGAEWFWDTLVDADLANNTLGWQWVAGCGADAAPFFRIFNPIRQGEKFDPEGNYVRQWVPELSKLPDRWIHKPWQAPEPVLKDAEIRLGQTYPQPIVDHDEARVRALETFKKSRETAE
jgi:deoxyribodipyrimidine photo-lyase